MTIGQRVDAVRVWEKAENNKKYAFRKIFMKQKEVAEKAGKWEGGKHRTEKPAG